MTSTYTFAVQRKGKPTSAYLWQGVLLLALLYCHRLLFGSSDNPSSQWGVDWDSTYNKNQCAQNEAVKGYSIDQSTGKIRSIYCCSYTTNP